MRHHIRYGGATCGEEERDVLINLIDKSIASGNWQCAEEGRLMEEEAAKFLGVKYGLLTTSGSCAGLLALSALELPKGSEVIIPAVTFPTIFNIILQCGLVPVVADCEVGTYNLDLLKLEEAISDKTRAIIAVHAVGNPVDMPRLMELVKKINLDRQIRLGRPETQAQADSYPIKNKIYVIEDNCDGWGSTIGGAKVGSFADISITSFHAAHIVSMGVGGGCFTNNEKLARNMRMYRDWGRQADTSEKRNGTKWKTLPADYDSRFIYEKIGYNFQVLELQAAMGRVQLRKTEEIKRLRKANFDYLVEHLSKHKELIMPKVIPDADVCWFALPLSTTGDRGPLIEHLEKNGIETRSMFAGNILKHPCYKDIEAREGNSLDGANYILEHSFWIGVHPRTTQEEREYIVEVFDSYYK